MNGELEPSLRQKGSGFAETGSVPSALADGVKKGPNQGKLALDPFAYAHGTDSSATREGERRMPATQTYLTVPQALDFVRLSVVIFGRIRK